MTSLHTCVLLNNSWPKVLEIISKFQFGFLEKGNPKSYEYEIVIKKEMIVALRASKFILNKEWTSSYTRGRIIRQGEIRRNVVVGICLCVSGLQTDTTRISLERRAMKSSLYDG